MTTEQMAVDRGMMTTFARRIFDSMQRIDQKRWAEVYLQGLLIAPGKKSVRKIADVVLSQPAHQSLQQFINQSPWDWTAVRRSLARHVHDRIRPRAWVFDQVVMPKRGQRSIGVERRFVPEEGRTVNCQIGICAFLASDNVKIPVNWRILLSSRWDRDGTQSTMETQPSTVVGAPDWLQIAEMVDEMSEAWRIPPAPVVADIRGLPYQTTLMSNLDERGVGFVFEIEGSIPLLHPVPAAAAAGPSYLRRLDPASQPVRADQYLTGPSQRTAVFERRCAEPYEQPASVVSSLARVPPPSGLTRSIAVRLLRQWSPAAGAPTRFWITNLVETRIDELMSLARLGRNSDAELQVLSQEYGLQDFKGRSFRGWHHHMTMVSAAYAYDRLHGCHAPRVHPIDPRSEA
jgi:hypothetical protein